MPQNVEWKPDYEKCQSRINAWMKGEMIDRVPVRFSAHNAEYVKSGLPMKHSTLQERWFDAEFQVAEFEKNLHKSSFLGETFPVYWPNLGPNVFAAFLGAGLTFSEVTSWAQPVLNVGDDFQLPCPPEKNEYFKKIHEMTDYALSRAEDKYYVGYTDIHGGLDCLDALMGTQELLMACVDCPELVLKYLGEIDRNFTSVFNSFSDKLEAADQPAVNWMNIPFAGRMHVPSCDVSSMLSDAYFQSLALPSIVKEAALMKYNIFHLDGKDVARHLDCILKLSDIDAIQWVQGCGNDEPILQWIPLIKKVQAAKKGIIVDLKINELDEFMESVRPEYIYLCVSAEKQDEQKYVINKLLRWK